MRLTDAIKQGVAYSLLKNPELRKIKPNIWEACLTDPELDRFWEEQGGRPER